MGKNYEITENPKILFDKKFDSNLVQLEGLKLGDDYRKINLHDVVGVYVRDYKDPYANFAKCIEQFDKFDGFIHMAGKFSFAIKDQKVSAIMMSGKYIDILKGYDAQMIVEVCGKPDKVLTDSVTWVWDYVEMAKILVYVEKRLYFFIDPDTKKLSEIRIGNVNEEAFQ